MTPAPPDAKARPGLPRPDVQSRLPIARISEAIGPCRWFALGAGMMAVIAATSEDEDEHAAAFAEFLDYRARYMEALADRAGIGQFLGGLPEIQGHRKTVHGFNKTLAAMSEDEIPSRGDALELARSARHDVLPAFDAILDVLSGLQETQRQDDLRQMAEKAAMVDGILREMGRIGRMIGLISINASVEAARAGGDSGRSFQVIAEEVRNLARQSSELLERVKSRLAEDATPRPPT
ncbi:methyl-accepting chemotaxis protein [Jannaschia marina]|uniref:methyl-accepting chemotaxis protein n=1 Tax=Jannaschia marina TaxID=2741674 RepID=UPI0015CA5057|nr:methyl-accepting chemotaxis protein [Jannaschia marina]